MSPAGKQTLEVEVFGAEQAPGAPAAARLALLCERAAASRGVHDGHVAIEFVDASRIAQLNALHRGVEGPTDVLSFPIDGAAAPAPAGGAPRELGDVVICAAHTRSIEEAVVHGVLHLLGMDHETDQGEMLALQDELLAAAQR